MYIAAHEDDTLLFQSPALLADIKANHCVRTVFLTAGDSGEGSTYWEGRETGAEVAYAQMAGVASTWVGSQVNVKGQSIHVETLSGAPGISIYYLRLPDGGIEGEGFPAYSNQSLRKLWNGGNGASPSIASIKAVDNSATYSYSGLLETLTSLMNSFGPRDVATQNYEVSIVGPDHADHVSAAKFTRVAQKTYAAAHLLTGFHGYETSVEPENVSGAQLAEKSAAFYAYGAHDHEACVSAEKCAGTAYEKWLKREYTDPETESTPGAVAGPGQEVLVGATVQLDGAGSFDPGGQALEYAWNQTAGPKVDLSDPAAKAPTFVALEHPAMLKFSLTVENTEAHTSLPSTVSIAVKHPPPPPSPTPTPAPTPPPPEPPQPVKLSQSKLQLLVGTRSRRVIKVIAPGKSSVRCRGALPRGARCRVTARHDLVIETTKRVMRTGSFRLVVHVTAADGNVTRRLTVVFRRP
jgi:LmbE family N-acetylglucosaminyl deacetylase